MTNRKVRETGTLGSWLQSAAIESPLALRTIHLQPVENVVRKSTPDREGYVKGLGQFWVELKVCARPVRPTTLLSFKFQDGQSRWLRKRWALGGSAWLLCQVGSGSTAMRYLIKGEYAQLVEDRVHEDWMMDNCVIDPTSNARDFIHQMATPRDLVPY